MIGLSYLELNILISGPMGESVRETATPHDVAMLVTYILLALVFSFMCSIAEAVLLTITPTYIAGLKERRPRLAYTIQRLKQEEVDRSLAAILTLNTIAHTVGAIGSGAKATIVFGSAYFGVFSALMTLMILFFSEIIPKTLGAVYWRRLTLATAMFVRALIVVLYPLIVISEFLTKWISKGRPHHGFSRREIVAMAAEGERMGLLHADESRVMQNLFRLKCLRAEDIMTPRTVMTALPKSLTVSEAVDRVADSAFSRLPVYHTGLDDVFGFVLRADLLLEQARGQGDTSIETLVRPLEHVTHLTALSHLLEIFLEKKIHLALVVDEYGGTDGLVSLEDVVETLLGMEIVDEKDNIRDLRRLARETWRKRAALLGLSMESDDPSQNEEINP